MIEADDINIDEYLSDDEIPDYRLKANNHSPDDDDKHIPYASGQSFHQYLSQQLNTFNMDDRQKQIAAFLVGSVDDTGYIRRELLDIVDDLAFIENFYTDEKEVQQVLHLVQKLDTAGVGAMSLQECLMLQLQRKNQTPEIAVALEILTSSFDAFSKKHFNKLLVKFNLSEDQLKDALEEIGKLNPKPGGALMMLWQSILSIK